MDESKKKKKKHSDRWYGMAFAPIFRSHSTTPRTTPDAGTPCPSPPSGGEPSMGESIFISAHRLVEISDPAWTGYGAPNSSQVLMKHGTPAVSGSGFQPVEPGQGGRYDFQKSPGLGFKTAAGWRIWNAVIEIMPKSKLLTPQSILQNAFQRAGVKMTDIDSAEIRLLEMGIEWYLSDPGRFPQPIDIDGGASGGVPFGQLKTV